MRQVQRKGSINAEKVPSQAIESIAVKFILNLPVEERSDKLRLAYHYKKAFWYYIDHQIKEIFPSQDPKKVDLKQFVVQLNVVVSKYTKALSAEGIVKILSMNRPTCGAIIFNERANKVLVISAKGRYGFPKGMKNENETCEDCAAREVKEEVGLFIHKKINSNNRVEFMGRGDTPVTFYIVSKFDEREELKIDKNEIDEAFWMSVSEVSKCLSKFSQKCRMGWREYEANIQFQPNLSMEQFLAAYRDRKSKSKQKKKESDEVANPLLNFKLDRDKLFQVFKSIEIESQVK